MTATNASPVEFHPYCLQIPAMNEEALSALSEDIRQNGLREPIVLYHEQVLDGRHRYFACQMAGVEPSFVEYTGNDPLGYVLSMNGTRRQATDSQNALAAARLANLPAHRPSANDKSANVRTYSQEDLAGKFCVSVRLIQNAAKLLRLCEEGKVDAEVIEAVNCGKIAINCAFDVSSLATNEQCAIVSKNKREIAEAVKGIKPKQAKIEHRLHNKNEEKKKEGREQDEPKNAPTDDAPTIEPEKPQNEIGKKAKEFNTKVLAGEPDGKGWNRNATEIRKFLELFQDGASRLPILFKEISEKGFSVEQEAELNELGDAILESCEVILQKLRPLPYSPIVPDVDHQNCLKQITTAITVADIGMGRVVNESFRLIKLFEHTRGLDCPQAERTVIDRWGVAMLDRMQEWIGYHTKHREELKLILDEILQGSKEASPTPENDAPAIEDSKPEEKLPDEASTVPSE